MEESLAVTVLISETVFAGISAQVLASYIQIPSIVFLLLFGILLGPDGFGFLHPSLLGNGLEVVVSLSVALILFEGGLNLQLQELGKVSTTLRNLVTIGVLITLIGGACAAHWLSEFPWSLALLYASLVVVTGPTVINPLLKQVGVNQQLSTLLEGEGVLIDPIGAILAVIVFNLVLSGNAEPLLLIKGLVLRLGIGGAIGVGGGCLLALVLKQDRFLSQELKNLVVLASVWGLFSLAQMLRSESGLMVAVLVGMVLRAASLPFEPLLRRFNEQLSILANSILFILLASDLSIASIFALGWGSVLTVLVMMLVVRPVNILVSTGNGDQSWQQKLFLAWIAPRGIVAASMASLFAISLTKHGINGGDSMKALVFLTVLMTVFSQGLTARWVASLLKLRLSPSGTVIVGSSPLSRVLVYLLQQRGEAVVLIDTNDDGASVTQENLLSLVSSSLDLEALEASGMSSVDTFLVLTSNPEVNSVLAQRAMEANHPHTLAILPQTSLDLKGCSEIDTARISHLFAPDVSVDVWNEYISFDEVQLGETILVIENFEAQQAQLQALISAGELIPMLVEREKHKLVALADASWQPGDRITCLLHTPKSKIPAFSQTSLVFQALKNPSPIEMVMTHIKSG